MRIEEIVRQNKAAGGKFFAPNTMKLFGSRLSSKVHEGPGGIFFVTSEKSFNGQYRTYDVRQFLSDTKRVVTVSPSGGFMKPKKAHEIAEWFARVGGAREYQSPYLG
jgi:hypothetical protein